MNHRHDIKRIETFVGKTCERTLACNSLKIRFGEKRPYIWIDPPWALRKGDRQITSSDEYPQSDDEFANWSDTLAPINTAVLSGFERRGNDALLLQFNNGYSLDVPSLQEPIDDEDLYHHWYASL